jgi:VanZ family protein
MRKRIILTLYIILILIVGLWPFNFWSRNNVEKSPERTGIILNKGDITDKYNPRGIVFSKESIILADSGKLVLEIWLKCRQVTQHQLSSIVSFYRNDESVLILEQWRTTFIIRVPDKSSGEKKFRHIGIREALPQDSLRHFTISFVDDGVRLYINGKLARHFKDFFLNDTSNRELGQLVIGNSISGKNPWNGEIHGLAVYNKNVNISEKTTNYRFWNSTNYQKNIEPYETGYYFEFGNFKDNIIIDKINRKFKLYILENFKILRRNYISIRLNERTWSCSFITDIIINILGFIPLGFLLCSYIPNTDYRSIKLYYGILIFICLILSMFIEISQAYIISRDSSAIDLILNTLGAILGLVLYKFTHVVLQSNRL